MQVNRFTPTLNINRQNSLKQRSNSFGSYMSRLNKLSNDADMLSLYKFESSLLEKANKFLSKIPVIGKKAYLFLEEHSGKFNFIKDFQYSTGYILGTKFGKQNKDIDWNQVINNANKHFKGISDEGNLKIAEYYTLGVTSGKVSGMFLSHDFPSDRRFEFMNSCLEKITKDNNPQKHVYDKVYDYGYKKGAQYNKTNGADSLKKESVKSMRYALMNKYSKKGIDYDESIHLTNSFINGFAKGIDKKL